MGNYDRVPPGIDCPMCGKQARALTSTGRIYPHQDRYRPERKCPASGRRAEEFRGLDR